MSVILCNVIRSDSTVTAGVTGEILLRWPNCAEKQHLLLHASYLLCFYLIKLTIVYIYISLSSEYLHHMETEEAQEMTQMAGKTQPPD